MASKSRIPVLLAVSAVLAVVLAVVLQRSSVTTETRAREVSAHPRSNNFVENRVDLALAESQSSDPTRAPAAASVSDQRVSKLHEDAKSPAEASGPIHLTGSVTDSQGRMAIGQDNRIVLTSASGVHQSAGIEEGRYSFDGLEPGPFVLECSIHGFNDVERPVTLRSDEIVHHEDITLEGAWMITVRILTPEGEDLRARLQKEPIAFLLQLSVLSTVEPPGEHLPRAFSLDRSGEGVSRSRSWWRPEERDDRVQILAEPPIYVSIVVRDQVLATQRVPDRVDELTFTISLDRLRELLSGLVVRLVDGESGAPMGDAWVNLTTSQSTEGAVHPDEQGIVRYENRVPGLYEVHAHMKDRAAETRTVELQPGHVTDLGTIMFRTGIMIRGKCVDAEGHPRKVAAGLVPIADGASADEGRPNFVYALKMDDQGLFSITSLSAGRYLVRIPVSMPSLLAGGESGWTTAPILIDTREGPVENLVIVVQRPVATLLRPISTDVGGMEYQVMTTSGLSYCDGGFAGSAPEHLELAPGTYTLRLTRALEMVREIPFTVGSNPLTIDVLP